MAKKKFKWWYLAIPALVAGLILVVFWQAIVVYAAPNMVLTNALNDTISRLDDRFRCNPIRNMLDFYDTEGRYTVQIDLNTEQDLLGPVSYDMVVQTDFSENQVLAQGDVGFSGSNLELSLYMNGDFMAVSSDDLLNGNYYGLRYETFSKDLDSFPLVKRLIPDATMQEWEASLERIQHFINRSYEVPEVTENDIRMLMTAILLLDSKVSAEEIKLNDKTVSGFVITYSAAGKEIRDILGYVLDVSDALEAELTASFYLYNETLVKMEMNGTAGENEVSYVLTLGEDPATSPLRLTENRLENGVTSDFTLKVTTTLESTHYAETVHFAQTKNGENKANTVSYDWDTVTGDMLLSWNNSMPLRINLTQNSDGICLETDDFAQLMAIALGNEKGSMDSASCSMDLRKGSTITAPSYKNLDMWTIDDLLTLLGGIGSLIGIDLG